MKNLLKFEKFFESKKDDLVELLIKLLDEKPEVKTESEFYPKQKGLYSLASIKKYFTSKGKTKDDADQAVNHLVNDKKFDLGKIEINHPLFGKNPYYYTGLTKVEVDKIVADYKSEMADLSKEEVNRQRELKSKAVADRKRPVRKTRTKK